MPIKDDAKTRILFWGPHPGERPQDFIRDDISEERRAALSRILRAGSVRTAWRGYARCRICEKLLGTTDLTDGKFVWPSKAEHYIEEHGVWTPGCDALLEHNEETHDA